MLTTLNRSRKPRQPRRRRHLPTTERCDPTTAMSTTVMETAATMGRMAHVGLTTPLVGYRLVPFCRRPNTEIT
jgi:hypothetical protein